MRDANNHPEETMASKQLGVIMKAPNNKLMIK
jgi:hypothetical protein